MNLRVSSIKVFLSKNGNTILSLVGLTFFARELGASQMGVFFLFQALVSVISLPTSLGLSRSVEKHLSSSNDPERHFATGFIVQLAMILLMALIVIIFNDKITTYIGRNLIIYIIIAIFLKPLGNLTFAALKGELRVGESASVEFAQQFVWVSVGGGLVWFGFGVVGIIIGLLAGYAIKLLWSAYKLTLGWKSLLYRPTIESSRSLFSFASRDLIGQIGPFLLSWTDVLIIGFFLSNAKVSAYEIAWRVAGIANQLTQAMTTTAFPQISSWAENESTEKIEKLVSDMITPSLILTIPALFGTILLSKDILRIIFGAEYSTGWIILIVIMIIQVISSIDSVYTTALTAMDYPELRSLAVIISSIFNIIFNIIMVIQFGLVGAAIATTSAMAIQTKIIVHYNSKFLNIYIPYHEIGWCVMSAIGMLLSISLIYDIIYPVRLFSLIGIISAGILIYAALIFVYSPIRKKIIRAIQGLMENKRYD